MDFINGKAEIKRGRKVIAKVYDKAVFYPAHGIKSQYQFPFSVAIMGGAFECLTLDEAADIVTKYSH